MIATVTSAAALTPSSIRATIHHPEREQLEPRLSVAIGDTHLSLTLTELHTLVVTLQASQPLLIAARGEWLRQGAGQGAPIEEERP